MVSETAANMMASLQHCLTLFHQQEDVRVVQLKQEQEKCRVLEEALNVLAKEHHELEQSVANHISETGTIPHSFSCKSSRIFDMDDEFFDAFAEDSDSDTLVQTESIFNTPSGSILTLLEDISGTLGEEATQGDASDRSLVRQSRRRVRRRSSEQRMRLLSSSTTTLTNEQYFTDDGDHEVSRTESTTSSSTSTTTSTNTDSSKSSSSASSESIAASEATLDGGGGGLDEEQSTASYYTQQCDDHHEHVVDLGDKEKAEKGEAEVDLICLKTPVKRR